LAEVEGSVDVDRTVEVCCLRSGEDPAVVALLVERRNIEDIYFKAAEYYHQALTSDTSLTSNIEQ